MAGKLRPRGEGMGANVWLGLAPLTPRGATPPPRHPRPSGRPRASGAGLLETGATTVSLPREMGALAPASPLRLATADGRRSAQLSGSSSRVSAKTQAAGLVLWPPERGLVSSAIGNQASAARPQCPRL